MNLDVTQDHLFDGVDDAGTVLPGTILAAWEWRHSYVSEVWNSVECFGKQLHGVVDERRLRLRPNHTPTELHYKYFVSAPTKRVIVLYVHACCIIVTWWDEPGEIESYLDN